MLIASRLWNQKVTARFDRTKVVCPIWTVTFLNAKHFLRHAAEKHFRQILIKDLPQFKCPYCYLQKPENFDDSIRQQNSNTKRKISKGIQKKRVKKSLIKRIDFNSKFVQNLEKEHPLYLFLFFMILTIKEKPIILLIMSHVFYYDNFGWSYFSEWTVFIGIKIVCRKHQEVWKNHQIRKQKLTLKVQ